jgi:thioredoxin 1
MEHLTKQTFKEKIFDFENKKDWEYSKELPAIIDFYADWCGPCKMVAPILEELNEEFKGKINIYKVNTDQERDLSVFFDISSIPTILFVPVNGKPHFTIGALSKSGFIKSIKDIFNMEK